MRLRFGLLLGLCVAASGCALTARPTAPQQYTLAAVAPAAAQAPRADAATLKVARIGVPAWLAGTGMYYRLRYRGDAALAAYTQSDWAAPPGGLLQQVVQRALARTGDWRVVVGPATPAHAAFSLYIHLDDFSQVFSAPGQSAGVLDATATLLAHADGAALAQRHFHVTVPAATANAAGGVAALSAASHSFAAQLAAWLADHVAPRARVR